MFIHMLRNKTHCSCSCLQEFLKNSFSLFRYYTSSAACKNDTWSCDPELWPLSIRFAYIYDDIRVVLWHPFFLGKGSCFSRTRTHTLTDRAGSTWHRLYTYSTAFSPTFSICFTTVTVFLFENDTSNEEFEIAKKKILQFVSKLIWKKNAKNFKKYRKII